MNKKDLRTEYLQRRRAVPDKGARSARILAKLEKRPEYRCARTVALYASLPEEVDTAPFIRAALSAGKRVCLPKISGGEMRFFEISAQTAFARGAFGIREPVSSVEIPKSEIDLVLVPLLAADAANHRLGFGGGYYDKYLADFQGTSIGICFQEQLSPFPLPHEAHDIALDAILSA